MKLASTIFSWLGLAVTIAIGILLISNYHVTSEWIESKTCEIWDWDLICNSIKRQEITYTGTPWYVYIIWIATLVAQLIILVWRQMSISNGKKTACGIVTLICVSVVGGLLTLLINKDELY